MIAAPETRVARLSPTIAKILVNRSPMHAWDAHRLGGNHKAEPSEAQVRGLALEAILFGDEAKLIAVDAPDYRGRAAQEARDQAQAENRVPVLAHKLAGYQAIADSWYYELNRLGIAFEAGRNQARLEWDRGDCPCSGVLDHLILAPESATIYDLKTCQDASPEACAKAISQHGYEIQHAAYVEAVETLYPATAGRVQMLFLFCEVERPYAVNIVQPAGTLRLVGRRKWEHAARTWAACLRDGLFPGYSAAVTRIEAKPWQMDQSLDLGGSDDGDGDA
jgi:hypothetical protein